MFYGGTNLEFSRTIFLENKDFKMREDEIDPFYIEILRLQANANPAHHPLRATNKRSKRTRHSNSMGHAESLLDTAYGDLQLRRRIRKLARPQTCTDVPEARREELWDVA